MKGFSFILIAFSLSIATSAQNVGIGTSSPAEKLDVAGGIKIGNTSNTAPGTIRWNAARGDFEGYNGKSWVSLTGGKSSWGNQQSYSYESASIDTRLASGGKGLGRALALCGKTVVAGAPFDNRDGKTAVGSAYIFVNTPNGWNAHPKVLAPVGFTGSDYFGRSVSITANRIAIGAPGYAVNGVRKGKVFVYSYDANGVGVPQGIVAHEGIAGEEFGFAVSLDSNTLAVGAHTAKIGQHERQGRVCIFQKGSLGWLPQATLVLAAGATGDNFGFAVSLSGKYLAISAMHVNGSKVYLYQRNAAQWTAMDTLTPPAGDAGLSYGHSLYLKNDTLVIGSDEVDKPNSYNGKAHLYVRNGTNWELKATLEASDKHPGDQFGTSVHYSNDRIIVGATAHVGASQRQGKAYIFKKSGSGWVEEVILVASQGKAYDAFGTGVAVSPQAAVVGAPYAEVLEEPDNGRVYFFNH